MNYESWLYQVFKRAFDIVLAVFILVFLSWLMVIISAIIVLDSKGPAIFKQKRVGKNGEVFTCYKLRTMHADTTDLASHRVSVNQVTRFGKLLRFSKLDELPQAWNVLLNEMAFVGPRPSLPAQVELITERKNRNVLTVKPGITGLSQIRNIDMSDPVLLAESDETYVKSQSIGLDLRIIMLTLLGRGLGDKIRHANS